MYATLLEVSLFFFWIKWKLKTNNEWMPDLFFKPHTTILTDCWGLVPHLDTKSNNCWSNNVKIERFYSTGNKNSLPGGTGALMTKVTDIKKTFCNVWFFAKCGTHNIIATTLIWFLTPDMPLNMKFDFFQSFNFYLKKFLWNWPFFHYEHCRVCPFVHCSGLFFGLWLHYSNSF